mmetsp:Transcript_24009/g.58689  ORF Transcript_24009/g.58689 Transcript_24009/m.58689 type:complete len:162 (-) Transcript_24009:274-759(-)
MYVGSKGTNLPLVKTLLSVHQRVFVIVLCPGRFEPLTQTLPLCVYFPSSNEWRKANGIPKIQIGGETAGLGNRYFSNAIEDAEEENQDVVDEFFAQAQEIAQAGTNRVERKKKLEVYTDRRKSEANDGVVINERAVEAPPMWIEPLPADGEQQPNQSPPLQ